MSFLSDPPVSPPVSEVYDENLASDGYVPNYVRLWCWRPEILESFGKLRADLLADSTLSAREVAVMVAATASSLGDSYCSLAWGEKLAGLSDGETAANVIHGVDTGLSEREAALAAWSRTVVNDPNATTEGGVDRLRDAGLTEREIFEATAWIGFRLGFSTINDALGTKPDAQLLERVPVPVREAVSFGRQVGPARREPS
jgi:alkylhydroperoxidase family enzyme